VNLVQCLHLATMTEQILTRHQGCYGFPMRSVNADVVADVHKDLVVSKRDESKFTKVGVRRKILQCVQLWPKMDNQISNTLIRNEASSRRTISETY